MARFGMFGDQEHRVFNYKPIYYDQEAEERRKMFGKVDGSEEKDKEKAQKGEYTPGTYIHGAFRGGNYSRRRGTGRAQSIIGLAGLLFVIIVLVYFTKFFSIL